MYSFRCKNCGHFETSDNAGECSTPHACPVCGSGVEFNKQGIKTFQPENWEILNDCSAARLKEIGLEPHQIVQHTVAGSPVVGKSVNVTTSNTVASVNKVG